MGIYGGGGSPGLIHDPPVKGCFIGFLVIWIVTFLASLSLLGVVIWVLYHFISKCW